MPGVSLEDLLVQHRITNRLLANLLRLPQSDLVALLSTVAGDQEIAIVAGTTTATVTTTRNRQHQPKPAGDEGSELEQ